MKKIFLISNLLFILLVSCNTRSAFQYSQQLVNMEKALGPKIEDTEQKVSKYFAAQQYDSMSFVSMKMEAYLKEAIENANEIPLPDAKEADAFKSSFLNYFQYLKSIYTTYRKVSDSKNDAERNKHLEEVQRIVNMKTDVLSKVQTAQKKFADANGFKVR